MKLRTLIFKPHESKNPKCFQKEMKKKNQRKRECFNFFFHTKAYKVDTLGTKKLDTPPILGRKI